jgi:uncharacterized protein
MIFIDTTALVAFHWADHPHHAIAETGFERLGRSGDVPVTSSIVLHEVLTFLTWKVKPFRHKNVTAVAREIAGSPLRILETSEDDVRKAIDLLEIYAKRRAPKKPDGLVSYCDCVSFVLMKKHGITTAFSFDRDDFRDLAGFRLWTEAAGSA